MQLICITLDGDAGEEDILIVGTRPASETDTARVLNLRVHPGAQRALCLARTQFTSWVGWIPKFANSYPNGDLGADWMV